MSESVADCVTIKIKTMLNSSSSTPSEPSIFRVGDHLRSINPEAYDPKIVAIGPYHRNKPQLQKMEHHKVRYLKLLLQRKGESSLQNYVTAMRQLEERVRKCYAEDIDLDQDEFVQMLILDACFILEFLRRFRSGERTDPIFQYGHIPIRLFHDLMVFENQIPFFVVNHLFDMIKDNGDPINNLIWDLLQNGIFEVKHLPQDVLDGHHLLGIVHEVQCSSFAKILSHSNAVSRNGRDDNKHTYIHSAVELQEAGVAFKKSEGDNLFRIEFKNKAMIMPAWRIYDSTESLIRNLIAYEHYLGGNSPKKYGQTIYSLCIVFVHSPEDARLLRRSEIISNFLGTDEMVYRVINQLGKNIIISDRYSYSDIFYKVNQHCKGTKNIWMATLRRDYFNSPWSLISFFAAITLLVLAVTQTTFAILSYRNDLKDGNTTPPSGKP